MATMAVDTSATAQTIIDHADELRAELCRRSLVSFLQTFWPYMSTDPYIHNWHIDILANSLEYLLHCIMNGSEIPPDCVINVPPGTTKSLLCSVAFPAWVWTKAPELSIITASYSSSLAIEHASKSRIVIKSDLYKALFPYVRMHEGEDLKSRYQVKHKRPERHDRGSWRLGGQRHTTSVGAGDIGIHGHIIIGDDPVNPKQALSSTGTELQAANDWYDHTLSTRKKDKDRTPTVTIMQRLALNDPSGHLLRRTHARTVHIKLPGSIRQGQTVKPEKHRAYYVDGLLDPKRLSGPTLDRLHEELGQYGYAGQIDQDPVPITGGMFDPERLVILSRRPERLSNLAWYWDKAGTAGGGTHTVGVLMGIQNDSPRYVVVKVVRGQWSSDKREKIIETECMAEGQGIPVYVEQEPGSGGKDSARDTQRSLARRGIKCYLDRPTGNKAVRADPLSVQVNAGEVGVINGPWVEALKHELQFFPSSAYKDQVDGLAGVYNKIKGRRQGSRAVAMSSNITDGEQVRAS